MKTNFLFAALFAVSALALSAHEDHHHKGKKSTKVEAQSKKEEPKKVEPKKEEPKKVEAKEAQPATK